MFRDTVEVGRTQKFCPVLASSRDCSGVCNPYKSSIHTHTHAYFLSWWGILQWWYLWNSSLLPCHFAVLTPSAQSGAVVHHGSELCKDRGKEVPSSIIHKWWDLSLSNPIPHWGAYCSLPSKAQNPIHRGQQRRWGWPAGTAPLFYAKTFFWWLKQSKELV